MSTVKDIITRLTGTLKIYEEDPESFEKIWNIPNEELQNLGIPKDFYEKMKEQGQSQIQKQMEILKIDTGWLVEITLDLDSFGKMAVPQKKLALFILEDAEEILDYIYGRKWFYMAIDPDRDRLYKKWNSHINAQMRTRERLVKAYARYLPTLTEKYKRLLAEKEAEVASLDKKKTEKEAEIAS